MSRVSVWMLLQFRKLGKKNKIGNKIRIARCLEKRNLSHDLLLH